MLQRARHLAGGRELHQREREAVLLLAEENLKGIESATRQLMDQNLEQLPQNLSDRVRRMFGKIDRSRAILTLATLGSSFFVRAGFKSIAATSPIAGTLAGTLIGGAYGAIRGYFTEKTRQFSPEAIKAEYDQISRESGKTHALAFLRTMLAEGDLKRSDFSGRLQLIALFLAEGKEAVATANQEDQDNAADKAVEEILANTMGMRENYHSTAKTACIRAMWPAAKKGMLWGAGFGLVSDFVSWFAGGIRAESAAMEHREAIMSGDNTFRADFHDNPPGMYQLASVDAINEAGLEPTDFGETLSRAFTQGITEEKIDSNVLDKIKEFAKARLPDIKEDKIPLLINDLLKHAQPLPEHAYFYHGQDVAINWDALNQYLETAFTYGADTTPEYLAEQLMSADSIISSAQEQMMTEGAAQAASEAAKESGIESAAHSAGIAAGAAWGSKRSTPEPEQGSEISLDAGQAQREGRQDTSGGSEREEQSKTGPEISDEKQRAERSPEAQEQIEIDFSYWSGLFEQNRDSFGNEANNLIDRVAQNEWDNLEDNDKELFVSLCAYMRSTQESGTKIIFTNKANTIDYTISSTPTVGNPQLKLAGDNGSETNIDLTDASKTLLDGLTIKIIET